MAGGSGGRERPGALPGAEVIGRAAAAPPPPGPPAPPRQVKEQTGPRARGCGVNGLALARPPARPAPGPRSAPGARSPARARSCARPRRLPRARTRRQRTGWGGRPSGSVIPQTSDFGEGGRRAGARRPGLALPRSPLRSGPRLSGAIRRRRRADSPRRRAARGSRRARPRKLFRAGGRRWERRGVAQPRRTLPCFPSRTRGLGVPGSQGFFFFQLLPLLVVVLLS